MAMIEPKKKVMLRTAKNFGAVKMNKHILSSNEIFSYHFFNAAGLEIAYCVVDLFDFCGVTKLEEPRQWSENFLLSHTPKESMA